MAMSVLKGMLLRFRTSRRVAGISGEEGSVSILTIGLFSITVAILILITDVASIAVSRQSLIHATEAAAIRAVHNIDLSSYYRGNSGVSVPIDCLAAFRAVEEEIGLWLQSDRNMKRRELLGASLTNFVCEDDRVEVSTSARAQLPFRLPQGSDFVEIRATAEAQSQRSR